MSYPEKYRKRVMEYLKEGHTYKETSETFAVAKSTVENWSRLQRETGSLKDKKPKPRTFIKIDPDKLRKYMGEHPDAYQVEVAEEFGCSKTAVQKALKRIGYTRKKNATLHGAGSAKGRGIPEETCRAQWEDRCLR